MLLEKICGLELPSPLAGTGECMSPPPRCQLPTASSVINSLPPLTIPSRGIVHNLAAPTAIPASLLLHNLLCRFELRPVFQRSRPAQGPAVTTLPQVLFHRFRCRVRSRETNLSRGEIHRETAPLLRRWVPRFTHQPGFRDHDSSKSSGTDAAGFPKAAVWSERFQAYGVIDDEQPHRAPDHFLDVCADRLHQRPRLPVDDVPGTF